MRINPFVRLASVCAPLVLADLLAAADAPSAPAPTPRESNQRKAAECYARDSKAYGSNTNFLVRPGLLADRSARRVVIHAESIHLQAGSPAEFLLIDESSGKDYEALAVSFAKPSAVHEALVFIGLPPGIGVDPSKFRFWPKGERVRIEFRYEGKTPGDPLSPPIQAGQLVIDTRTGKTLPDTGFVFTGSSWVTLPGQPASNRAYAADTFSPNSIVAVYNEPVTVLDVPRRAAQHEVYSYQVPNPDTPIPSARFTEVTLTPDNMDGRLRVCDLTLNLKPHMTALPGGAPLLYVLREQDRQLTTNTSPEGLLAALADLTGHQRDAFVKVVPDDELPLAALRGAAALIDTLDSSQSMRVEPPPAGHPYYRCFLPDDKHRERAGRPVQPWELYLGKSAGAPTGELVLVEEDWQGGDSKPTYRETRFSAPTPEILAHRLKREDVPSVVLVFAPSDLRYGEFRKFVAPILERGMILYVFLPRATPAGQGNPPADAVRAP